MFESKKRKVVIHTKAFGDGKFGQRNIKGLSSTWFIFLLRMYEFCSTTYKLKKKNLQNENKHILSVTVMLS